MSELKIDLNNIRFAIFKQVFSDVEATLKHLDVDFYVIGALARDMLFSIDAIPTRTTADVDLAVYTCIPAIALTAGRDHVKLDNKEMAFKVRNPL